MAAAVADFRPVATEPGKIKKAGRAGLELSAGGRPPTCSPALAGAAPRGPDAGRLRRRARRASGRARARQARRQGRRRDRRQRHLARGHRLRRRRQRGHDPHAPTAAQAARIASRARPRRRSPRRSSTPSGAARRALNWAAVDSLYDLYQRGCELLEHGDYQAAIVPLSRARDLEPDKASIREALGRALFHAQRYEGAAEEFERGRREHADQRLRAVLPRALDAAAGPPPRGLPAARAGLLAASRARGLSRLSRPRPARRDVHLSARRKRARCRQTCPAQAARCYARSRAFVPACRAPAAVPKVGAGPLFLRKGAS